MSQNETVGDIFSNAKNKALKTVAIVIGLLVYLGMIVYSGIHNYTLMTKGVPPDMLIWAMLGIIGLEATAIGLPIGLHWWMHSPLQRFAGIGFYIVDLLLVFVNVVLDFAINSGGTLPSWGTIWLEYVVPATPILVGVMYSILFMLDPSQIEHQLREQFMATVRVSQMNAVINAARNDEISKMVNESGQRNADLLTRAALGYTPARPQLNGNLNGKNGHTPALPPGPQKPPRQFRMTVPVQAQNGKLRNLPKFITNRLATTVQCPICGDAQPVKELETGELECLTCRTVLSLNPTNGGQPKS